MTKWLIRKKNKKTPKNVEKMVAAGRKPPRHTGGVLLLITWSPIYLQPDSAFTGSPAPYNFSDLALQSEMVWYFGVAVRSCGDEIAQPSGHACVWSWRATPEPRWANLSEITLRTREMAGFGVCIYTRCSEWCAVSVP